MSRITNEEQFQEQWNNFIPTLAKDEVARYLIETSQHHPNPNMVWLYDRLLGELINDKD